MADQDTQSDMPTTRMQSWQLTTSTAFKATDDDRKATGGRDPRKARQKFGGHIRSL